MRRHGPFVLLLLGYLLAGGLYALLTPDWQAPDEPAHYNYVRQLASGRLPVIQPGDYDQEYQELVIGSRFDPLYSVAPFEYEDYQPPLYYLLLTPLYWLFDGALRPLRLLSVLLGAVVVWLAYSVALRLFPQRAWLALTAAAFVAFLPQHVAMMAAVNNDSLAELLIAAILLAVLVFGESAGRGVGGQGALGPSSRRLALALGLLLGLGFLTKVTVAVMVPVVGMALAWTYRHDRPALLRSGLLVFGTAAVLGLPWWVRNALVYDGLDILGTAAHNAIVTGQPRTAEWIADRGLADTLGTFLRTTFQSFWGQFGWMGVPMPSWVYQPLLLFALLTLVGLALAAVRSKSISRAGELPAAIEPVTPLRLALLVTTFVVTALLYVGYNVTFVQHQGRYLFPALVPISLAVAAGWAALWEPLRRRWPASGTLLPAGLALSLICLDLLALFRFILPSLA